MILVNLLLIIVGPYLVVGAIALVADPKATIAFLTRPVSRPPMRPVTRPRPARWAVA
jgi:hypothetical protein